MGTLQRELNEADNAIYNLEQELGKEKKAHKGLERERDDLKAELATTAVASTNDTATLEKLQALQRTHTELAESNAKLETEQSSLSQLHGDSEQKCKELDLACKNAKNEVA